MSFANSRFSRNDDRVKVMSFGSLHAVLLTQLISIMKSIEKAGLLYRRILSLFLQLLLGRLSFHIEI